jgi:hypothetical protein
MWEIEELHHNTPFIAITVMFLVTQVRFWSLLLYCKKKKEEKKRA